MKAWFVTKGTKGPRDLKLGNRPDPEPGPKDVLVRMRAASLNYRDQVIAQDKYMGVAMDRDTIALSDGAGEVVAVGGGVTRFKTGDRVIGTFNRGWIGGSYGDVIYDQLGHPGIDGVLSELVVFAQEDVVSVPGDLSYEEASCLPCAALTAWSALVVAGRMKPGQTVLTLGTGGVSIFALQLAKAAGCYVICTSSSDEKLERARHWARIARSITGPLPNGMLRCARRPADAAPTMSSKWAVQGRSSVPTARWPMAG